ncbi:MAG: CvpA family protein [Lachnospiraceae bacterium]|nr:CvpA family protein [Lachnospiraceae bacterium]MDY5742224.1 CvpA family protein [Lachnospiraceae bacterium]
MNWLTVLVVILLVASTLWGFRQGLMKKVVSLVWLILSLILVSLLMPQTSKILREQTGLHGYVSERATAYLTKRSLEKAQQSGMPVNPTTVFEWQDAVRDMDLPALIDWVLQSKSSEGLNGLKSGRSLQRFAGDYIADITVNVCGFLLAFILVATLLRLLLLAINLIDKLPVIKTLNHLGGAGLGLLQGLLLIWLLGLIVTAATGTSWGQLLQQQISESPILRFINENNILLRFVINIKLM